MAWDGRGAVRPELVERRRRVATWAAVVALSFAVPTVIGSSAGWWSAGTEQPALAGAGPGPGPDSGGTGADGGSPPVDDALGEPGDAGVADDGAGGVGSALAAGLGGRLLDADLDPGAGCELGPPGEPVRIGVVVDGRPAAAEGAPVAVGGEPLELATARHLAALANCGGGVLGRPVEVASAQATGSALAISSAVTGLVAQEVAVIIGPPAVEVALQLAEVAGPVPVVVPWSIEPALNDHDRGLFLIDPDVTALADAAARLAADRGWRRLVLFTGSGSLDDLAADGFARSIGAGRREVVAELPLVVGDDGLVDLDGQLERFGIGPLSSAPPDAVFTTADMAEAIELAVALDRAGVEVPVVAMDRRRPAPLGAARGQDRLEIVGRWPAESGGRADRLAVAVAAANGVGGRDDGGDSLPGSSVDAVAAARVADAILVALDAVDRGGTSDPAAVAAKLRLPAIIDGVSGPTGVWPGRTAQAEPVPIPVLGAGPDGPVLVATVEPPVG